MLHQTTLAEDNEAKDWRLINGRQLLQLVYESRKLIENILSTTLTGDQLTRFLTDWDTVLVGPGDTASEATR